MDDIEIAVLKAMHSRRVYGKHHKRFETVIHSGFPSHLLGDVKKAIYSLIKQGFIVYAKRSKEAIQLNKEKLREIEIIIKENS